jgi:uncharacterized protein
MPSRALAVFTVVLCAAQLQAPAIGRADATTHRHAAVELLDLMDQKRTLDSAMNTMLDVQTQANPSLAELRPVMRTFLQKHMSWDAIKDDFARIYVEAFSEPELRELIAFYKTPIGRKSIKLMPKLMEQGAQIGAKRVQEHMPELQQQIQEHMSKKAKATPTP